MNLNDNPNDNIRDKIKDKLLNTPILLIIFIKFINEKLNGTKFYE